IDALQSTSVNGEPRPPVAEREGPAVKDGEIDAHEPTSVYGAEPAPFEAKHEAPAGDAATFAAHEPKSVYGASPVVPEAEPEESGFRFVPVPKEDSAQVAEIEDFVIRYEWLESMTPRPSPAGCRRARSRSPSPRLKTWTLPAMGVRARVPPPTDSGNRQRGCS